MSENFIEKFDKAEKRKGLFLFLFYVFTIILGVNILELTSSSFLVDNATFVWYSILFIMVIVFFCNVVKDSITNIKNKKEFFSKNICHLLVIGFVTLIFTIIVSILINILGVINQNQVEVDYALKSERILMILTTGLLAPIVEEFIYRYFIFRTIRKYSIFWAHLITALLFGFSHVWFYVIIEGNILSIFALLPTFCFGLGCSITYEKTKCIIFPIGLHMALNIISSI